MNFETLQADINLLMNKHYTKGRGGHKIDKILIHPIPGASPLEAAGIPGKPDKPAHITR